jgi:hypothetical protein
MIKDKSAVVLSHKEWRRIVQLIENEHSWTEAELVAHLNNDQSPLWSNETGTASSAPPEQ